MQLTIRRVALVLISGLFSGVALNTPLQARAAFTDATGIEAGSRAPADSPDYRKYAPDRDVDVLHLALEVTPDFKQRSLTGRAVLSFQPIGQPLSQWSLDAVDLDIQSVEASHPLADWQNTGQKLVLTFASPIDIGREGKVTVIYRASPAKGLYFRTPEMGYREGETHLFTQGQAIDARHWYPGYDAPNEKFTSEVLAHVPAGMIVLSNGRQVSDVPDPQTGRHAVRWIQDQPHVNYLVALVAGFFDKVEDTYGDIPLAFFTPPSAIGEAPNSFRGTKDMMAFFEQATGVPYPWAKYFQVCVNDFVAGGMENTSLTILTDSTLFPSSTENLRSSEGLVAHELAHMWFGDLVTCKDWSHLWLNEGFATYYEALYDGHRHGHDAFLYNLFNQARGFIDTPNDTTPIVYRQFNDPSEQFSFLAYPKGSWVVHMLRSQLGDDLFRRIVKTYLDRHRFGLVTTDDFRSVIEEFSGRSFDQFFDQWVYHAHHPELEIDYAWDEPAKLARVSVRQVQSLSDKVLLFNFPLPIRFVLPSGPTNHTVRVRSKDDVFHFRLPEAPRLIRIDPDLTVLSKVRFTPPPAMTTIMLTNSADVIGRLLAVEALSGRQDADTIARLRQALTEDAFHGVRIAASQALRAAHSDEALDALLGATNQPDARVRRQVREDLGAFYRDTALEAARAALATEKNPEIVATLLRALAPHPHPEVRDTLLGYLQTPSFHNELTETAIETLRAQGDPASVAPILDALARRAPEFTSHGTAAALHTLAFLARNEDNKDTVRAFIVRHLQDRRPTVQQGAIAALGALGDPQAVPVLETFARADSESPERQAADRAIASLRAARKPTQDLGALRNEVMELQRANRDLRREFDALNRKIDQVLVRQPQTEPAAAPKKTRKPGDPARPKAGVPSP